jgi:hypothetical protein
MAPQELGKNPPTLVTNKSLAIPAHEKRPSFDEVAAIALMGATICGQSVCVLCLTQELLEHWMYRLEGLPAPIILLDVVDTSRTTLADWKKFLSNHIHDVTVLHGAFRELKGQAPVCRLCHGIGRCGAVWTGDSRVMCALANGAIQTIDYGGRET